MSKVKKTVFDRLLFSRLLSFTIPYYKIFIIALLTVLGLSIFGALRPKVLQVAMDNNIENQFKPGFIKYMAWMFILLFLR